MSVIRPPMFSGPTACHVRVDAVARTPPVRPASASARIARAARRAAKRASSRITPSGAARWARNQSSDEPGLESGARSRSATPRPAGAGRVEERNAARAPTAIAMAANTRTDRTRRKWALHGRDMNLPRAKQAGFADLGFHRFERLEEGRFVGFVD